MEEILEMQKTLKDIIQRTTENAIRLNIEVWRPIKDYSYYEVSSKGNVRNVKTKRVLKYGTNSDGYYQLNLYKNGKSKTIKVHRLVAEAFIDNPDNKPSIDHIDCNKLNNKVENLRFATLKENQQNRSKNKNNTSGIKGVVYYKRSNKWLAYITFNGTRVSLGYFKTLEEAQGARIKKANEAFGNFVNACEKE